ncbi:cell wall hydrolase [Aminipila sp.]|uniref:cell wall hydrolase n=1 Tax=Aminipila sp. TaxID=2060095 RepID=UPI00289DBB93|nr:cell wall hydrolase [Aminipila sp.]
MNKTKKIRLIFLALFLTSGIALFLYTSTASTQNHSNSQGLESKTSQLDATVAIKSTPDSISSNMKQLSEVAPEGYPDEQMTFFNGQTGDEGTVISRGLRSRDTYKKEKSVKPSVATADWAEENKEVNEIEIAETPQDEVRKIEAPQSTQRKDDSPHESDLDLLARLITAEAQGEPYEAKVAVGAVVINRVNSGVWAHTIKGVIYQNINGYYQFTPVVNGWIDKPAQPECIQAAEAAMNGADPTGGAQFYYDDKTTNAWILSKPVSVQIGHMIYAY